jgi:hypothetical protein
LFGIVAERIGKARVGGRAFTLTNGATPEGFFAAPTGRGSGAGNPAFDFAIRELGSTMPTIVLDLNFNLTADGRTATFTDVDGDLVTVKRSAGAFVAGDFIITPADSGGGSLDLLTVTSVAGGAPVNLSITAQSSGDGGNGLVNVGAINALGDLGAVFIAGELGSMDAGDSDPARPGVRNLTVRSLGTLSGHSGDHAIDTANGIGTVTVATSVRDMAINAIGAGTGRLGVVTIGGSLVGNSVIDADGNIGFVKIGGNMAGGRIVTDGRIGAIAIRGNLIGTGGTSISASASTAGPTTGLDLAIKSLTVIGTVENTRIEVGLGSNADASIGAINVGREWLVGSVLAGVAAGADNFIGTADDTKTPGAGIDVATRFSTIASINIRGQALGSAANADSFGFVAERIARAKIGSRLLVLNAGERDATDAFAIAPTAAGVGGLPFDVIVREITA